MLENRDIPEAKGDIQDTAANPEELKNEREQQLKSKKKNGGNNAKKKRHRNLALKMNPAEIGVSFPRFRFDGVRRVSMFLIAVSLVYNFMG